MGKYPGIWLRERSTCKKRRPFAELPCVVQALFIGSSLCLSHVETKDAGGRRKRERREPEGPGCLCYGMETRESLLLLVLGLRDMLGRKVLSKLSLRGAAAARA